MTLRDRLRALGQGLLLGALVGVICGAASALFLTVLDLATNFRTSHQLIVYCLPVAGLALGAVYEHYGQAIKGGTNLILHTFHHDGPVLPMRMAPMVLVGTVLAHLFGGSVGREGTAVQMGASLSDALGRRLGVPRQVRSQLLTAGIAGGFGSVFGTPLAGVVFGLEVLALGPIEVGALLPALVASVVGDMTTRGLGVAHTPYPAVPYLALSPALLAAWLAFAIAVALTSTLFIVLTQFLKRAGERYLPRLPLRMFVGGLLVVLLWRLVGTNDYLGLGIPTLLRAFEDPAFPVYGFALKLLFTAITLAAGFLGGEVTPLFFVGAALGSAFSRVLEVPMALAAGVGMAAVFAASAHTPLALSIMAVELLGAPALPHVAVVSVVASWLVGNRSIYPDERRGMGPPP